MKKVFFCLFLMNLHLSVLLAQVNQNRYVKLVVETGENIKINLFADKDSTQIQVVCGTLSQILNVDSAWTGGQDFFAETDTMFIYGNLLKFDCSYQKSNIKQLDISHNAELDFLFCCDNAITDINVNNCINLKYLYCYNNIIFNLDVSQNTNLTRLDCSNNNISTLDLTNCKKLKEIYCDNNRLTSLNLNQHADLLYLSCAENNISTLNLSNVPNLKELSCGGNGILQLELTQNPDLEFVDCGNNLFLSNIDVSKNLNLKYLVCNNNALKKIDITNNSKLFSLNCADNLIDTLEITTCPDLDELDCSFNAITTLDLSFSPNLTTLYCGANKMKTLNIENNKKISVLAIYDNLFSSETFDEIMCSLSNRRDSATNGIFIPLKNTMSAEFNGSNSYNATWKNWKVLYWDTKDDCSTTIGNFLCDGVSIKEKNEENIVLYPNPAYTKICIEGTKNELAKIYDYTGRLIKQDIINECINIENLSSGLYIILIGNKRARFIKQ